VADQDRVLELIRTVAGDAALRDRLGAASEADRGAILEEVGFGDVTPADVAHSAHLLTPEVVEEISDEQLASVAGGGTDPLITTTTTTTTIAISAAVAT
jgi:hypothetical protein